MGRAKETLKGLWGPGEGIKKDKDNGLFPKGQRQESSVSGSLSASAPAGGFTALQPKEPTLPRQRGGRAKAALGGLWGPKKEKSTATGFDAISQSIPAVALELATQRKKQENEASGLEPITGGWGDPETVKRLQEQSDTAQQVKGLLKEQEDIRAAQEQALIDSGERAPTYDLSPWDTPLDTPWVSNTMEGAAKTYGGSLLNLAGTVAQTMGELTPDDPGGYGIAEKMDREPFYNAARALKGKGRELTVSGSEAVERAKEGKGALGRLGTDVAVAGAQMLADQAANLLVPGSGMALMAARSAGSGMMEAENAGADTATQLTAGAAAGAISWLTENLSNIGPLKDIYGEGLLQKLAPRLAQRLTSSPVGTVAMGFLGEAGEEVLEDVLGTAAAKVIYDPDARVNPEEALYDGLVGGIIGAIGGGVEVAGRNRNNELPVDGGEQKGKYQATRPENVDMPMVPIIDLSTGNIPGVTGALPEVGNSMRAEAIQRARKRLGLDEQSAVYIPASNVLRDGAEYILKITKASLNKMLSPADGGTIPVESIVVMDNLERIANNGVYCDSSGDRKGRPQIKGIDQLRTTVYIDGVPYSVNMRVRLVETRPGSGADNVLYYYTPEEILTVEKVGDQSPTVGRRATNILSETMPTDATLPQPGSGVKAQDLQQPDGYSGSWTAPSAIGLPFNRPLQGASPIYSGPITPWSELSGLPADPLMRAALEMAESGAFENDPVIPTEVAPVQPRDTAHSGAAPTEIPAQEASRSAVPEGEPIGLTVRQRLTLDEVRYAGHSIEQVGMALKRMGPEAIRGVINQGLCSAPDMGSSTRAQVLRRKLDAGESITPSELGHLYDALCREPTQWGSALGQTKEADQLKPAEGSGIINSGAISGALNPLGKRAAGHAGQYYDSVRKMTTDAKRIAQNVGYAEEQIQRIKNYLFMDIHDLGDGRISRFDPSYEIAQSWQRLIDGKSIQPHDMTLLLHEIMEQELVDQGYSQNEAHIITSQKYNYAKEAYEYYDKIGAYKED